MYTFGSCTMKLMFIIETCIVMLTFLKKYHANTRIGRSPTEESTFLYYPSSFTLQVVS